MGIKIMARKIISPIKIICFTVVLSTFLIVGLGAGGVPAAPLWPHEQSDLQPDPALRFGRFDNGFRYVIMKNARPENRVSMHLNVQAGSFHEADGQEGLAHFLEHMLFCGSTHFAPGELMKYFQRIGMGIGPDANAHTSFFETVYDIYLPDNSEKSLSEGLLVMQDYAEGALLLPSEIDRERKVILAEKRTRDSVSRRTFEATIKFELPGSRLSRRIPIGEEAVIRSADKAALKAYYDAWYRPEKMMLVLAGDLDPALAAGMIEKRFSSLAPRAPALPEPDLGALNHDGVKTFHHFEKEAGNTTTTIEIVRKRERFTDSFDLQKALLTADVADRIVQDRLDAMLRKPGAPFTSAGAGSGIFLNKIRYAAITADSKPENWQKVLAILEQTLRQALTYGFTDAELERVKKDFRAGLDNAVKEAPTRESDHLARRIIGNVNGGFVFQSPQQEKDLYGPVIDALTLEDVNAAFQASWAADHRLVLMTGNADPADAETAPETQIMAAYDASRSKNVSRPAEAAAAVFPYLPEPSEAGVIASRTELTDPPAELIDFENGVRLNLMKTGFEANQARVNLTFGKGRYGEPPSKPGLAELSEAVIDESGLGGMDRDALERALAGKDVRVGFSIEEDRFVFRGQAVSDQIALLFQLLYAYRTDPGFRNDAFALVMERLAQKYKALSASIDGAMLLKGKRFLAGGDPRFGLPPFETLERLSLADVRAWITASLATNDLEITVVGDMDPKAVTDLAARYFGGPAPFGNASETGTADTQPRFPSGESLDVRVDTEIPKALAVTAYPSDAIWDIRKTRRFSVLANIFSDRMREIIREKMGATYSPFAYNDPSRAYPGYGALTAMSHVDPAAAASVADVMTDIGAALAEAPPSEDALKRALDPLLTGIRDSRKENSYWLETVLTGSKWHPEQIEWSRTILEDYASISATEVHELAKASLGNNAPAVIIIRPAEAEAAAGSKTDPESGS